MTAPVSAAAWPYPFWLAHRGAGKLAPENTLAAFRQGARLGYQAFECDVKLSADGVAFLLHDDTLERTTSGAGPAANLAWGDLSRLDAGSWHSREFAGEPPASLKSVSSFCLAHGAALNIELKPSPGQAEATGRVVAASAAALWAGAALPPLLSSFDPVALAAARAAVPDMPRALLIDALREGWWEQALALGCTAVVGHHSAVDTVFIGRLHGAGLRALAYTVNDAVEVARLTSLGIDGLITDAVDRFDPGSRGP